MDFPFADLDSSELSSLFKEYKQTDTMTFPFANLDSLEFEEELRHSDYSLKAKNIKMIHILAEILMEIIHKDIPNLNTFIKTNIQTNCKEPWAFGLRSRCEKLKGKWFTPDQFDIPDLYVLIRAAVYYGISNIVPPTAGWGNCPAKEDNVVLGDDLERVVAKQKETVRRLRIELSYETYKAKRDEIKSIAKRLQSYLNDANYEKEIDEIDSTFIPRDVAKGVVAQYIINCMTTTEHLYNDLKSTIEKQAEKQEQNDMMRKFLFAKTILMIHIEAELIRKVIHKIIPQLHAFVKGNLQQMKTKHWSKNLVKRYLELQKQELEQDKRVIPEHLDLSCLYSVVRAGFHYGKVTQNEMDPPTAGWGNCPSTQSVKVGDDIERVRERRNTFFHHQTGKIEKSAYEKERIEIKASAKRLEAYLQLPDNAYAAELDDIHNVRIDDKEGMQELFQRYDEVCCSFIALGGSALEQHQAEERKKSKEENQALNAKMEQLRRQNESLMKEKEAIQRELAQKEWEKQCAKEAEERERNERRRRREEEEDEEERERNERQRRREAEEIEEDERARRQGSNRSFATAFGAGATQGAQDGFISGMAGGVVGGLNYLWSK